MAQIFIASAMSSVTMLMTNSRVFRMFRAVSLGGASLPGRSATPRPTIAGVEAEVIEGAERRCVEPAFDVAARHKGDGRGRPSR